LALIYQKIKNKNSKIKSVAEINIGKIRSMVVSGRHNQYDPTFYRKVSEINNVLKEQLDTSVVDAFMLTKNENGIYRVRIDSSKIDISPKLISN
jgi:glutamine amidotransferase-like uncharacterized protein